MLFADASQVIQVEWQALAAFGSAVGGAIVWAGKVIAGQLASNAAATNKRHEENRQDAAEARAENRSLSQAILMIQGKTVESLGGLQGEIERIVTRLDRIEGNTGSKSHAPLAESHEGKRR